MNTTKPEQQIFRQNLKLAPYFGSVGGLLAVIPGFWTPLYIPFLTLAAIVGGIAFLIACLGLRRGIYLGPVSTIVTIFSLILGRDILSRHYAPHGISFLCQLQAIGIWMFVFAALHIALREKLKNYLEANAA